MTDQRVGLNPSTAPVERVRPKTDIIYSIGTFS
jgi:hypothetical protein